MSARKKITFLTDRERAGLFDDDMFLIEELKKQTVLDYNIKVWDECGVDELNSDLVIIRSCWDYTGKVEKFLGFLSACSVNSVKLMNPPAMVCWNIDKNYLFELGQAGLPVVPTSWIRKSTGIDLHKLMNENSWSEVVVKPAISSSAHDTYRVTKDNVDEVTAALRSVSKVRDLMVQPFAKSIQSDGEISLMYFNGKFSHAVLKKPAQGDFRVQFNFGGTCESYSPGSGELMNASSALNYVQKKFGVMPLYARLDFVRIEHQWSLIEMELIEPYLYLGYDNSAAYNLLNVVTKILK